MEDSDGDGSWFRKLGPAADAGWTLSGSIIVCLLLGYGIGAYFDANPGAAVTGLVVGVVVGMYNLAKIMLMKR